MDSFIMIISVCMFALCWGSFLNVIAYRLTFDQPFFTQRSRCPSCKTIIAAYDNIPIISWLLLKGRCRTCSASISWIYPFTEIITGLLMVSLVINFFSLPLPANITINQLFPLIPSFIFFTALIIATATDFYAMVIPQLVTLWLIPLGILCAFYGFTSISLLESIIGIVLGYGVLWITALLFKRFSGQDGIGIGDMELLGMIGSFLGPQGAWFSLMGGSMIGLLIGGLYLFIIGKNKRTPIPFGPFLALGAIIFFFFKASLSPYLFENY